jgi:hypothetical protein
MIVCNKLLYITFVSLYQAKENTAQESIEGVYFGAVGAKREISDEPSALLDGRCKQLSKALPLPGIVST